MTAEIGRSNSGRTVEIDIEKLVETHLAVVSNPGGGKSYTVRKVLELAAGGPQRIVLDVEDEFYTLREATPSLIIAGGSNGDCPARVENSAALARFLLETGADAVIQINDLGLTGQRLFIASFLEAMVSAPTELWHPALIVLDEVQRVAPEGAPAESSDAVVSLLMQGRKRGFGALIATQRLARVSKNVTGAVNNWLLGRAGQTIDRRAVAEMLGVTIGSDEAKELPRLHPGRFWGFGPAIAVEPMLIAIGKAKTTHLRAGQRDVPTPPAPEQIRAMLAQLHVAEANEGHANPGGKGEAADLEAAEARGYERGIEEGRRQGEASQQVKVRQIQQAVEAAAGFLAPYLGDDLEVRHPNPEPTIDQTPALVEPPWQGGDKGPTETTNPPTPAQQKVLDAIAWLRAARIDPASRIQVAFLSGYSPTSSSFVKYVSALRTQGYLDYPNDGEISLTALGRHTATTSEEPLTSARLHARLRERLGAARWSVLAPIIRAYPGSITRDRLAGESRYSTTSSSFVKYVSGLRSLGLIDYPNSGEVRAERVLFIDDKPRAVMSQR